MFFLDCTGFQLFVFQLYCGTWQNIFRVDKSGGSVSETFFILNMVQLLDVAALKVTRLEHPKVWVC